MPKILKQPGENMIMVAREMVEEVSSLCLWKVGWCR